MPEGENVNRLVVHCSRIHESITVLYLRVTMYPTLREVSGESAAVYTGTRNPSLCGVAVEPNAILVFATNTFCRSGLEELLPQILVEGTHQVPIHDRVIGSDRCVRCIG